MTGRTGGDVLDETKGSMAISVVVPHYGAPGPTAILAQELLHQGVHEVIVSDDQSPVPFPDSAGITVVRRPTNGGFAAAVNSGAERATGKYILVLNSDLEVSPDFLKQFSSEAEPWQPAVVAPRVITPAGEIDHTVRAWPSVLNQTLEWLTPLARWRGRPWFQRVLGHDPRAFTASQPIEVDWVVGAAFMVPTADFRAVGGLDERFHMNSEEIDLQRRLAARGLKRIYLPAVTVVHEGGGSSDPAKRRRWLVTSQFRYARKWGGLWRLKAALTGATVVNFMWNCIRALRGIGVKPIGVLNQELDLIWGNHER